MRVSLRPEDASDEAFSMRLFASTRAGELALLAGAPAAQETFIRLQYTAQRRAYEAQYPEAERSIVLFDDAPGGRVIFDRSGAESTLVDISLLPEHRGRGAGATLLTTLLDEAAREGRPVALHVLRTSAAARLYARLGFVRVGGNEMHDKMVWSPPRSG